MATEKRMSEEARAITNISMEFFFFGLSIMTITTSRFREKLSNTENTDTCKEPMEIIVTNEEEINTNTNTFGWSQVIYT